MYIAGFDGGGSTARLVIATRQGEIVFRQDGKGVNAIDNPNWREEYNKLFALAGDYIKSVQTACFGVPGWGEIPQLDIQVCAFLHQQLSCPIKIINDVELSFYAAFNQGAGILILSGTGSMAIGRDHHQNFIRAGGFGHLIGDEGSAYWIGQQALMRLAREIDGRAAKSGFGEKLSKCLNFNLTLNGIMTWLDGGAHTRSHIASVAKFVDEIAESSDGIAQELLTMAAQELFTAWQAVHHQLNNQAQNMPWAMAGSTFHSNSICRTMRSLIGTVDTKPARSALEQALHMALYSERDTENLAR